MALGNMLQPGGPFPPTEPQTPQGGGALQGPPRDPQHLQIRQSGWQKFFDRLVADPNLQTSLLSFGAQLLQPRGVGQTQAGAVGEAAVKGVGTYKALGAGQRAEKREEEKLGLETRQTAAVESTARTAREKLPTEQERRAEIRQSEAYSKYLDKLGAAAGRPNVSIGAQESLALRLADGWIKEGRYTSDEANTAEVDAINYLLTLDRTSDTPAEFELKLRQSLLKDTSLMQPEEIADAESMIAASVQEYTKQRAANSPRGRPAPGGVSAPPNYVDKAKKMFPSLGTSGAPPATSPSGPGIVEQVKSGLTSAARAPVTRESVLNAISGGVQIPSQPSAQPGAVPQAAAAPSAAPAPGNPQALGDALFQREAQKLQASGRATPEVLERLKLFVKQKVPGWSPL